MEYVEGPYPVGVVVVYSSSSTMAVMIVPSGTLAPSNVTVPVKRQTGWSSAEAMQGKMRSAIATIKTNTLTLSISNYSA